jgi:hypothetical protein
MTDVACFCGCLFSFRGEVGVCPRCGEYASLTGVSPEVEEQMRRELALLTNQDVSAVRARDDR